MLNKNTEMGFQNAVIHLCQQALVSLFHNDRGPMATASLQGKGKLSEALLITQVLSDIALNFEFYSM